MDPDAPATRRDLEAGLAGLGTDLRGEIRASEERLRGEIRDIERRLHVAIADWANRIVEGFENRLCREMATWSNTIIDTVSNQILAFDDRYRDVPERLSRLELRVDRLERDRGGGSG